MKVKSTLLGLLVAVIMFSCKNEDKQDEAKQEKDLPF